MHRSWDLKRKKMGFLMTGEELAALCWLIGEGGGGKVRGMEKRLEFEEDCGCRKACQKLLCGGIRRGSGEGIQEGT